VTDLFENELRITFRQFYFLPIDMTITYKFNLNNVYVIQYLQTKLFVQEAYDDINHGFSFKYV
jgi:hypothetical protein